MNLGCVFQEFQKIENSWYLQTSHYRSLNIWYRRRFHLVLQLIFQFIISTLSSVWLLQFLESPQKELLNELQIGVDEGVFLTHTEPLFPTCPGSCAQTGHGSKPKEWAPMFNIPYGKEYKMLLISLLEDELQGKEAWSQDFFVDLYLSFHTYNAFYIYVYMFVVYIYICLFI